MPLPVGELIAYRISFILFKVWSCILHDFSKQQQQKMNRQQYIKIEIFGKFNIK